MTLSQGTAWFLASVQPAMDRSGIKNTYRYGDSSLSYNLTVGLLR